MHPESGAPVQAGVGRFGPYILHEGRYVSLKPSDDVLEIDLDRALELLSAAPVRRGKGERSGGGNANVLHELGEHPEAGGPIQILAGRYGPYVKHGKINVTIPKGIEPANVTVEQAVSWLAEKAANGAGKTGRGRRSSSTASKSGTKKAATKKSTSKKATTTKRTAK
jgi:DNA topoisomerase-1